MKTLRHKINDLKEEEATTALAVITDDNEQMPNLEFGMILGASGVLNAMAESAMVKAIKALTIVKETKSYRQLNYQTFEEFLDKSPHAPMNYAKFNRLENQMQLEGETAFETLNALGVPMSKRKLLTPGIVEVKDGEIIIGNQSARFDDRVRITEIIKTLVEENTAASKKIEKGAADNLKLKKKLDDAMYAVTPNDSPVEQTFTALLGNLSKLALLVKDVPLVESEALYRKHFSFLSPAWSLLVSAYRMEDETTDLTTHPLHDSFTDDEIAELGDAM